MKRRWFNVCVFVTFITEYLVVARVLEILLEVDDDLLDELDGVFDVLVADVLAFPGRVLQGVGRVGKGAEHQGVVLPEVHADLCVALYLKKLNEGFCAGRQVA